MKICLKKGVVIRSESDFERILFRALRASRIPSSHYASTSSLLQVPKAVLRPTKTTTKMTKNKLPAMPSAVAILSVVLAVLSCSGGVNSESVTSPPRLSRVHMLVVLGDEGTDFANKDVRNAWKVRDEISFCKKHIHILLSIFWRKIHYRSFN